MIFFKSCWFVYDLCGIFCMVFAEFLLLYAAIILNLLFIVKLFQSDKIFLFIIHLLICNYLYFISSFCHLSCSTTDPGVIPNGDDEGEVLLPIELQARTNSIRSCSKCNAFKPPRTHHCSVCKRCIFKMDHHCPWINNCVGINNQKQFLLFLIYVFLFCTYSLTFICHNFYKCLSYPESYSTEMNQLYSNGHFLDQRNDFYSDFRLTKNELFMECKITPLTLVFGFTVIIESLIFGIFSIAMFIDQIICIINNTTGIEHLKQECVYNRKKGIYSLFVQVFGSKFSWKWLFPTKTRPSFMTDNFDLSLFLDMELTEVDLDLEHGLNNFDQAKLDCHDNENISIMHSNTKLGSNYVHCCKISRNGNLTNMIIPEIIEDSLFYEGEDCIDNNHSEFTNKKEIRMNEFYKKS